MDYSTYAAEVNAGVYDCDDCDSYPCVCEDDGDADYWYEVTRDEQ